MESWSYGVGTAYLDTAQTFGKGKDFQAAQESAGLVGTALDAEAEHATESFLLLLGKFVLGVRR